MEEIKKHGGRRSGAGRPVNDRNYMIGVRISEGSYKKLQNVKNKAELIDNLIKRYL